MTADPMTLFGMAMAIALLLYLGWRRRGWTGIAWHQDADGGPDGCDDGGGGGD